MLFLGYLARQSPSKGERAALTWEAGAAPSPLRARPGAAGAAPPAARLLRRGTISPPITERRPSSSRTRLQAGWLSHQIAFITYLHTGNFSFLVSTGYDAKKKHTQTPSVPYSATQPQLFSLNLHCCQTFPCVAKISQKLTPATEFRLKGT